MINKEILTKYDNLILATIYRMKIKDKDTVDNLHSDCWIRILESQGQYNADKAELSTWIVMICKSVVANYIVTRGRSEDVMENPRVSLDAKVIHEESNEEAFSDVSDRRKEEILEEFAYLIADFPSIWQKVLKLKLVHGYTQAEMAGILGINAKAVNNISTKAMRRLKGRIKTEDTPREHYGPDLTLQDMYNTLPKIYKFPFKFRVVEGKTWKQVQKLINLPVEELESRVNIARDMIFLNHNVEV